MLDFEYSEEEVQLSNNIPNIINEKKRMREDVNLFNKKPKTITKDNINDIHSPLLENIVKNKRIVIAVGGNALLRRGEIFSYENQVKAAMNAARIIKYFSQTNQVILTHGNGPQIGALALERKTTPFDILGAETQGQIGYIFSQAFETIGQTAVSIITQVLVDKTDIAFNDPTKYIGKIYTKDESDDLIKENNWNMKQDGKYWRRVIPSPQPLQIQQIEAVRILLESQQCKPPMKLLPILCGGGGIPIRYDESGCIKGVEAVIDKDNCSALLANEIDADIFIILTDGGGIYEYYGTEDQREMIEVTPEYLIKTKSGVNFPGSMGPKINAVVNFVQRSNKENVYAIIGDLLDAENVLSNISGTKIKKNVKDEVIWRDNKK